jgi:Na+/H+ antiporter NhaD/arsenite permease-like protein
MPTLLLAAGAPPPPALAWITPFALLLLAIAVLPLVAHHWWERNRNRAIVAATLALPAVVWAFLERPGELLHAADEYAAFCLMLTCLFVVSGGLVLEGDLHATPRVNTTFLAVGALLANLVGTTGAAMLLVRPLLRTNARRKRVVHTFVFFIFVVCNTGGCLTPLADPPLYLGYLEGVPFGWTLRLFPYWLAMNGALLAIYYAWDRRAHRRETSADLAFDASRRTPLRLRGKANLLGLLGVVALVALRTPSPWLEVGFAAIAAISYRATPRALHELNGFTWTPIVEVAILFAGIFATMVPALAILDARGAELGITTPGGFFWATGCSACSTTRRRT